MLRSKSEIPIEEEGVSSGEHLKIDKKHGSAKKTSRKKSASRKSPARARMPTSKDDIH